MLSKIKNFIIDLLLSIKKYISKPTSLEPSTENEKNTLLIENTINVFRTINYLLPLKHNEQLKLLAKERTEKMVMQNEILYDYKGLELRLKLNSVGLHPINAYMMASYGKDDKQISRNILSSIIYRNMLLSSNFDCIGVYAFNNYCAVIITSNN